MTTVRIFESADLPILDGILEVDTSNNGIMILMRSAPKNSVLTITKISSDHNMVSLFSETTLMNDSDIIIFGLPIYAKVKKGKVKTIVLKSDGINWKIIKEY